MPEFSPVDLGIEDEPDGVRHRRVMVAVQTLIVFANDAKIMAMSQHFHDHYDETAHVWTGRITGPTLTMLLDAFETLCSIMGVEEPFSALTSEAEQAVMDRWNLNHDEKNAQLAHLREDATTLRKANADWRSDLSRKIIKWRQEIVGAGAMEMTHAERRGALQLLAEQMYNDLASLTRDYGDIPF
jgi:hypothetical protein